MNSPTHSEKVKTVCDANAFLSFTVGEERVIDSYRLLTAAIDAKRRQLKSPIPFTIRDEIDMHKVLLQYIDACIAQISTMQALMAMPRLVFAMEHNLLRLFRDHNHHTGYLAFKPADSNLGQDFFAWPTLRSIDAVRKKYADGTDTDKQSTLFYWINKNHTYVLGLIDSERKKFHNDNGVPLFKFRQEYAANFYYFKANNSEAK